MRRNRRLQFGGQPRGCADMLRTGTSMLSKDKARRDAGVFDPRLHVRRASQHGLRRATT